MVSQRLTLEKQWGFTEMAAGGSTHTQHGTEARGSERRAGSRHTGRQTVQASSLRAQRPQHRNVRGACVRPGLRPHLAPANPLGSGQSRMVGHPTKMVGLMLEYPGS